MNPKEFAAIRAEVEWDRQHKIRQQLAEIQGIQRNPNGSLSSIINIVENMLNDEGSFKRALAAAIQETIHQIASVIINERRAEIEEACNFGELRDVLAAELARQFMASRLTNQPTPFDAQQISPQAKPMLRQAATQNSAYPTPGYGQGVSLSTKGTP